MSKTDQIILRIEICRMQKAAKDFAREGKLVKSLEKLFFVQYFQDELEQSKKTIGTFE